jgi:hypothetical protein
MFAYNFDTYLNFILLLLGSTVRYHIKYCTVPYVPIFNPMVPTGIIKHSDWKCYQNVMVPVPEHLIFLNSSSALSKLWVKVELR